MNWLIWALLSAFFAGLTAILAKIGVQNINSNLATAIRTVVILIFVWTVAPVGTHTAKRRKG
jgi:bacterial/archaeal transporter family protein